MIYRRTRYCTTNGKCDSGIKCCAFNLHSFEPRETDTGEERNETGRNKKDVTVKI